MPNVEKILYFDFKSEYNTRTCENCKGINFIEIEDFISCTDCGNMITRILNCFSSSDIGRVNPRRIYISEKKPINK